MWTPFNETTYIARHEIIAAPPAAAKKPATPPADPHAGPVVEMSPAEWHSLLLTTLAPFREAREAMVRALKERLDAQPPVY